VKYPDVRLKPIDTELWRTWARRLEDYTSQRSGQSGLDVALTALCEETAKVPGSNPGGPISTLFSLHPRPCFRSYRRTCSLFRHPDLGEMAGCKTSTTPWELLGCELLCGKSLVPVRSGFNLQDMLRFGYESLCVSYEFVRTFFRVCYGVVRFLPQIHSFLEFV